MEQLHHRLIRIGLDALAEDFGYALAGGYAVQAHHLVKRVSEDVDFFTPIDRAEDELPRAVARVVEAYESAGFAVQIVQQALVFARLLVTDPGNGAQSKVELVGDFVHHPPVESSLGPVLHLDDLAAAKTGALLSRAEVRDAIDVDALMHVGYTSDRLLRLVAENEVPDLHEYARALARVQRYTDKQFAAYGVDDEKAVGIRERFAAWQRAMSDRLRAEGTPAGSPHSRPADGPSRRSRSDQPPPGPPGPTPGNRPTR